MVSGRIEANKNTVNLSLVNSDIDLNQIVRGRSVRRVVAIIVAISLLYLVLLMPGLLFLAIPREIALLGKGYDETRIMRLLRYGEPLIIEHWEAVESQTEGIRIKSSDNRNITLTSAR